jgi:putative CocE/NonD family hydrolase
MSYIATHHVQMPMRDGALLSADIYRPASSNQHTTVLTRTCYTKATGAHAERAAFWAANGYAYIVQDVRGRGDSEGVFYPLIHETEDGSDTLDWIASQPWSDGRVVMVGGSYLGWTQLYAACSGNPHLTALVPMVTPSDPDRSFPMSYGMVMPAAATWMATLDGHINQDLSADDVDRALEHRPIIDFDKAIGRNLKPWQDWVNHAIRDEYWERQAYQTRLLQSSQPMLHVSGWYDDCLSGALENFTALSSRKFKDAPPTQRLLIGPWLHGAIGQRKIGAVDFGAEAQIDLNRLQLDWFDACLQGKPLDSPPVQIFVMGRNSWLYEQEWPIARTQYVPYYLHSAGRANTAQGDGVLSTSPPQDEPADHFDFDPENPVPYSASLNWKQVGGPDDCASLELRADVLVYTGPVLQEPLLICGPLHVKLYAASSTRDTDWTAKIIDVHPDGRAIRLNDGAVRARFRRGHDHEVFLTPGGVEEYEIDCWATCMELQPGHRLRLEISSSAFGKYDVNLNAAGRVGHEVEPLIAQQKVYHDVLHPSHIVLPILR